MALGVLDLVDRWPGSGPGCDVRTPALPRTPPRDRRCPSGCGTTRRFHSRIVASPVRQEHHVGFGQLVLANRPGQLFDPHSSGPAIEPPHVVEQKNRKAPDRDALGMRVDFLPAGHLTAFRPLIKAATASITGCCAPAKNQWSSPSSSTNLAPRMCAARSRPAAIRTARSPRR
jgi:hypothetical protein